MQGENSQILLLIETCFNEMHAVNQKLSFEESLLILIVDDQDFLMKIMGKESLCQ